MAHFIGPLFLFLGFFADWLRKNCKFYIKHRGGLELHDLAIFVAA